MKFILSFLIVACALSADTCTKLSLGNAALTPEKLCSPVNSLTPSSPVQSQPPALPISIQPTIKCDLPTIVPTPPPIVSKITPAPIVCPPPAAPPVINPPGTPGGKCDPPPATPNSATPEPASYALLGAGLMTAGIARRFRNKKQ